MLNRPVYAPSLKILKEAPMEHLCKIEDLIVGIASKLPSPKRIADARHRESQTRTYVSNEKLKTPSRRVCLQNTAPRPAFPVMRQL